MIITKPADTLKERQAGPLLARFEGLFQFWGKRYPEGLADGLHLWSDDITNSARLAFFSAFVPHCEAGALKCHSAEVKTREVLRTATGRIRRKMQPVYNGAGDVCGHELRPVYRIKREYPPSCEKAAIYALQSAKWAAMQAARVYTRHGLKETTFSSLDLKPGQSVVEYLDSIGESPAGFAMAIGVGSPWIDHTLRNLAECIKIGPGDCKPIREAVAKAEVINGQTTRALQMANRRGLVGALLLRMTGLEWREVADLEGINLGALKVKLHRLRAEIGRVKPTA